MSKWNIKRWCWWLRIFSNIFIAISMLFSLEFRSTCNWKRFSLRRESIIVKSTKNCMKVVESFSNCQNQRKKGLFLLCSMIATTLLSITAKNTDWSDGPLARPFARSLAPLIRSLAPESGLLASLAPSAALIRSLARSHRSLTRSWGSD